MRAPGAAARATLQALLLLLLPLLPGAPAGNEDKNETERPVMPVIALWGGADRETAAALQALAGEALRAGGARAEGATAPMCPGAADSAPCLRTALASLEAGRAAVAVLPAPPDAPAARRLRDAGLEELGELAPPVRRACRASRPPARSLLDLADPALAALYAPPATASRAATFEPPWCAPAPGNRSCAELLTSDAAEAGVLAGEVRRWRLHATVSALGAALAAAAAADRPLITCDWAPELSPLGELPGATLGPPPCEASDACPFESRRVVKYANVRALAAAPRAYRALVRLSLSAEELRALARRARSAGGAEAAREAAEGGAAGGAAGEVRVAVSLPGGTRREAYDGRALAAAAMLAEERLEAERPPPAPRLKVELYDDRCSAARAYKYLMDARDAGEYGALSALAGPACGAAFADVARQSGAHRLPLLAYTPQAPPAAGPALLAAGDARERAAALGALLRGLRWRRLAVLSEAGARPQLDAALLGAELVAHVELPDRGEDVDYQLISQWAGRVAAADGRIVLVCAEDARVVRAALCAGRGAGLLPAAGAVWLLPALPPAALRPAPADPPGCSAAQLAAAADGHLTLQPEWERAWLERRSPHAELWRARWRRYCRRGLAPPAACDSPPGAAAALLYDALRLWADALAAALAADPAAADDLHARDLVRRLLANATSGGYVGLTGPFEWTTEGETRVRVTPLVVTQWRNGTRAPVGRWARGALRLDAGALVWAAGGAGGAAPGDGGERCALRPLAELLRADCSAAVAALAVLALGGAAGLLGGAAVYCKRRVERQYRARLAALGLTTLAPKAGDLDRWELPRERVVINRKLGTGAFGTVYGGHALLAEDRGWSAVAVKTLKEGASTDEKLDFLSEAEAMKRFDHKNVVRLLGVVTKTEPVCTVMEFMLYGDLKNYLLARRHLAGGERDAREEVSPRRLTAMALDVARALGYLAQLRYVHRDVAARNCLVSAGRVVKLADFGMTRLVFENDYYRFSRKGMLPVRWMAPESLALGVFSPASDVWSFGVLLYEIVTFGALPFQGMSNGEVLAHVKAGGTLDLPPGIKPRLEGLIKTCWQQDYKARPAASELADILADAPRLLLPCPDVPLDALPLPAPSPAASPRPARHTCLWSDAAEARWVSWAAPQSTATDTTYLSAETGADGDALPAETDTFLP